MKVDILDEQVDAIVIAEMKTNIEDIEEQKDKFSDDWEEYLEAFKKVLHFYGG